MTFEEKYKVAIELLGKDLKQEGNKNKPLVPHLLRVGKYLFENDYSEDVVNAGLLHDLIEWTDNPEEIIEKEFNKHVYEIVLANTKNREIKDPDLRKADYVNRCAEVGKAALIVKAADVLDNFQYYTETGNEKEMARSKNIAQLILEKVEIRDDLIFKELNKVM